jgi:hypothetical protein
MVGTLAVYDYVVQRYLDTDIDEELSPQTRLLETGVIDESAMRDFAHWMETVHGIKLSAEELKAENFETLERLSSTIVRHLSARP